MLKRAGMLLLCVCPMASAAFLRLEVSERTDVLDGQPFGNTGPYERIAGRAYFAVDPKLAANQIITDIDKKPFQDAVKPVWDKYGAKYAAMVKRIEAVN